MKRLGTFAAWSMAAPWLVLASNAAAQVGSIILVTTSADTVADDGACSLREAIIASNSNSNADGSATGCVGTGIDSIRFSLGAGTPQINVLSALPSITAQVTLRGNTGGATRVELRGPGSGGASFSGLAVLASSASVRSLVINNFRGAGISILASNVTVTGCLIGTAADGVSALPNTGDGVFINGFGAATNHVIGGTGAGEANVIAFNGGAGVLVAAATGNAIRANSIHDNAGLGIDSQIGGNGNLAPPYIVQADTDISGTSNCASCTVDVYADTWNEGETWLGSATVAADGSWGLVAPAPGPYITATVTNASGTSEFSQRRPCQDFDEDGLCDGVDDSDLDAVADAGDNCMLAPNGPALPDAGGNSQCDSDGDGYGNLCDGDMNQNNVTNNQDYGLFRAQLGQPSVAPTFNKADINCNGTVNNQDYGLFRGLLGAAPGPSGLHRPTCTPGAAVAVGSRATCTRIRRGTGVTFLPPTRRRRCLINAGTRSIRAPRGCSRWEFRAPLVSRRRLRIATVPSLSCRPLGPTGHSPTISSTRRPRRASSAATS